MTARPGSTIAFRLRCREVRLTSERQEFGILHGQTAVLQGRSPRMRGKLPAAHELNFDRRPIPAYAGETYGCNRVPPGSKADPRVCGGNINCTDMPDDELGRSPRMRGKRMFIFTRPMQARPIPAYAGETMASCLVHMGIQADPRVCGGNSLSWVIRL